MVAYIFNWLFVFTVPWQNMVVLPGLGTISKLLGVAAVGATIFHVLVTGKLRRPTLFHWLGVAFFGWILLSTFWGIALPLSIQRKVITYVQLLAMIWVIWETTPTRSRLAGMLQAYVMGAYVAAGSTIFNYLTGAATLIADTRFAASGFDANDVGMMMALGLPMAWYLASSSRTATQQWLNRAYFVVGILGILLTGSRGAMLASLVALSVVPWTLTRMRMGVKIAALVGLLVAGVAAVQIVPAASFERLSTTGTELSEGTLTGRVAIWQSGLRALPRRFLHGYGPAGWYPAAGAIYGKIRGPHNTWLSIVVEQGAIGFLLFVSMFVVILRRLRTLPTFERRIGLILLATLALAITPLSWDVHKAMWLVLSLLAGWPYVAALPQSAPAEARPRRSPLRRPRWAPAPAIVE